MSLPQPGVSEDGLVKEKPPLQEWTHPWPNEGIFLHVSRNVIKEKKTKLLFNILSMF